MTWMIWGTTLGNSYMFILWSFKTLSVTTMDRQGRNNYQNSYNILQHTTGGKALATSAASAEQLSVSVPGAAF